jgi:hypothetical protein
VLFAVGVLALAGWLMSFPVDGFRYTAGLSGTPGTFTAAHCHTYGSGRTSERVCTGTFTSADGRLTDTKAHISNGRIDVGKHARLRRRPDGGYVQPGLGKAILDLAAAFGIVGGAAFLLMALCATPGRVAPNIPLRANPRPWGTLLFLFALLGGGCLFAALLFYMVAILCVIVEMII